MTLVKHDNHPEAPPGGKNHNEKPIQAQNAFPASRRISSKRGGKHPPSVYHTKHILPTPRPVVKGTKEKSLGNTAKWELRASADLLPQSRSMKNGKYIQYSRIFHTFARVKISRRISLPHYAVLP